MENKLNIIQKIAQIAKIVCQVLFIICLVCAGLALISGISYSAIGDFELKIGGVSIEGLIMDNTGLTEKEMIGNIFCVFIEAVIGSLLFGFSKVYLENELKDGTPFTERGAREFLRLGILVCAIPQGGNILISIITKITDINNTYDTGEDILFGLLLILMSFIFSYGAEIRKGIEPDKNQEGFISTYDISDDSQL